MKFYNFNFSMLKMKIVGDDARVEGAERVHALLDALQDLEPEPELQAPAAGARRQGGPGQRSLQRSVAHDATCSAASAGMPERTHRLRIARSRHRKEQVQISGRETKGEGLQKKAPRQKRNLGLASTQSLKTVRSSPSERLNRRVCGHDDDAVQVLGRQLLSEDQVSARP